MADFSKLNTMLSGKPLPNKETAMEDYHRQVLNDIHRKPETTDSIVPNLEAHSSMPEDTSKDIKLPEPMKNPLDFKKIKKNLYGK